MYVPVGEKARRIIASKSQNEEQKRLDCHFSLLFCHCQMDSWRFWTCEV